MSVMREEITLGARMELEDDRGFGKELFADERVDGFAIDESRGQGRDITVPTAISYSRRCRNV